MWKGNWIPEKGERSRDCGNYCEESSKVISEDRRGFLRLMTDSPAKASQLKDSAVGRRETQTRAGESKDVGGTPCKDEMKVARDGDLTDDLGH